jgi:CRISPR-associated endonuclease/helicase Cas3
VILGKIKEAIVEGGTVAVICNTVAKAQNTYAFLNEHLSGAEVDVDLFHARYPYGQRKLRQDRVLANFGKAERDPRTKRVLVATQVIEQSLDLDFDLMITELAPVDLILQRLGRLHRHHRAKRAAPVASPALYIIEPKSNDAGLPDYAPSKYVYFEHILLRSQLSLKEKQRILLPTDIECLVEKVYGEEELAMPNDAWVQRLAISKKDWEDDMANQEAKGNARVVPLPTHERPWDATRRLLKEDDPDIHQNLQAQTRDSPPNVMLICLYGNEGVPSLDPEGSNVVDLSLEASMDMIPKLLDRAVAISYPAVVRFFKDQPTPSGWRRSSLLSHYKVAVFNKVYGSTAHYCACGGTCLVLSDELGLSTEDAEAIEL